MTFEPTNPIPGEDDDQPVPHQQQRQADPYRHPAGRSCAESAGLIAGLVALLALIVRRGER